MKLMLLLLIACTPLNAILSTQQINLPDLNNAIIVPCIEIVAELHSGGSSQAHYSRFRSNNTETFFRIDSRTKDTTATGAIYNSESNVYFTVSDVSQTEATITYTIDDKSWKSWLLSPFSWFLAKSIILPIGQEYRESIGDIEGPQYLAALIITARHSTTQLFHMATPVS